LQKQFFSFGGTLLRIRNLVGSALGALMLGAVCPASWGAITDLGPVELGVPISFGGGTSASTLSDIFLFPDYA
jgi:hypothetical protein